MVSGVENILNNDEFFADTDVAPKECVKLHGIRENLKSAMSKGKVYLLVKKLDIDSEDD